jgi:hypothetical protein
MSDKSKLYTATSPRFASKSHAFCSRGRTSCEARSLKAPEGATHASHGQGRKAAPWLDCERATRAQQATFRP